MAPASDLLCFHQDKSSSGTRCAHDVGRNNGDVVQFPQQIRVSQLKIYPVRNLMIITFKRHVQNVTRIYTVATIAHAIQRTAMYTRPNQEHHGPGAEVCGLTTMFPAIRVHACVQLHRHTGTGHHFFLSNLYLKILCIHFHCYHV